MPNLADRMDRWWQANRKAVLPALVLCTLYTLVISWFRDYQYPIGRVLAEGLAVFILLVYAPKALEKAGVKQLWPMGVFGAMAAFFIVAMRTALTPTGGGQWGLWLALPFLVFAATYILCCCGGLVLLGRISLSTTRAPAISFKRWWLGCLAALLVMWLPYFATFGPVRMSADSTVVINQALGQSPLNDAHPIAYTLVLGLFLRPANALGLIELGAYAFGFFQMAGVAATLAYTVAWLRKNGCPTLLCFLAMAMYGISPVFAVNAITLWKDIPFNCLLLLLMLRLYEAGASDGAVFQNRRYTFSFIALCVATCFARGNGFMLVLFCCAVLVLVFRRQWRRLVRLFVPMLLIVALVRGPVYGVLGITRLGNVESAAMPLQQVGRVLSEGGALTDAQQEVIERFVPVRVMAESYYPTSPDYIKGHAEFDREAFHQNTGAFLKVWLQLMPRHPQSYLNAWLAQTIGYWKYDNPGTTASMSNESYNGHAGIEYKDILYRLTGLNFHGFFEARSGFFPLGLMAHIALYAGALLLVWRKGRLALFLLPPLLVWLGMMLGAPTYNEFRYMLVFALGLPVLCILPLMRPPGDGPLPKGATETAAKAGGANAPPAPPQPPAP